VSSEESNLECVLAICFLTIWSSIALMMGPFGLLFIVFAVLVFANGYKKKQEKKMQISQEPAFAERTHERSAIVTVDRRVIYNVPRKCPECGGSINNEDVDWVGPLQAKCPYCQTTIEAQPVEF
jgi:endogenous inhibitor of DNA gyrase (YacG/DUF329 family)